MKVLVTGGGGFLGSHLVERLEAEGHDVFAARHGEFDLTHWDDTARMFDTARPERVFHLAAEVGGIGANLANPGRYWYANLMMGAHVLEQSRIHGVEKLVIVGTVCAYPKFTPVPFKEENLWDGYPEETNAPYGVAKKTLLVGAESYRAQYGLHSIFLLPTNLYGPRDKFHPTNAHVIPDLIRKMVESPARPRGRRLRRAGAREPRRREGDLDSRARGARRRRDGVHGTNRVGRDEAQRTAEAQRGRIARARPLRLRSAYATA
jgi:GDP-L-fucose synthase